MSMEHNTNNFEPTYPDKNPMNRLDSEYDHLIGYERKRGNFFMIICVILMLYIPCSLLLYKKAINMPKSVPLVIEVQPWGEAKNMGNLSDYSYGKIQVSEAAREWQVKDFVKKMRTISSDPQVVYDNISSVFSMITTSVADKVREDVKNPDIFAMVGKTQRNLIIESVIKVSETSYQIDWIEKTTGEETGRKRLRGVFTIALLQPSEKQAQVNPLGIFIKDYDMTEIKDDGMEEE